MSGSMVHDESPAARELRLELQKMGDAIAQKLLGYDRHVGFVLVLADFGDRGAMSYVSSVERETVVPLLRELAGKLSIDVEANKLAGGGSSKPRKP